MRNNLYWQRRMEELERLMEAEVQGVTAEMEAGYRRAQAAIEKEIRAWYQRFANNNEIPLAEAKRLLNSREMEELRWDVQEYIRQGERAGADAAWMKQLENASARYHVTRLDALKLRTQQHAELLYGNQLDEVDGHLRRTATDGYYRTLFEYQRGFGVGWDVGGLDGRRVDLLVHKPWAADGHVFSQRIWSDRTALVNTLHSELLHGCMLGKPPDDAIKAIAKKMATSAHNAGRLVMTESAAVYGMTQGDAYKELDVEEYEIVSTLDGDTSPLCRGLDGRVYAMKDYKVGDTAPPFHPWCRTVTVPHFKDIAGIGQRAARGEDGKTYYVPADTKYEDWLAAQTAPKAEKPEALPPAAAGATMSLRDCGTIEEVNRFVAQQLAGRGVTHVDYTGMELELAKSNAEHLLQLSGQYNSSMVSVQVSSLGRGAYAQVVRFGPHEEAVLEYGRALHGKSAKLESAYMGDVARGYHPKGTEKYWQYAVTTHEFAHTLSSSRVSAMTGGNAEFWDKIKAIKRKYITEINRLKREAMQAASLEEGRALVDRYREVSISEYAKQNADEFMAEAFAMATLSEQPSPYAMDVLDLVEEVFGRQDDE